MDRINNPTREKHRSGPEPNCCDFQIFRPGLDREGEPTKHSACAKEAGKEEFPSQAPSEIQMIMGKGLWRQWDRVRRCLHQLLLSILILDERQRAVATITSVQCRGRGRGEGFVNAPGLTSAQDPVDSG